MAHCTLDSGTSYRGVWGCLWHSKFSWQTKALAGASEKSHFMVMIALIPNKATRLAKFAARFCRKLLRPDAPPKKHGFPSDRRGRHFQPMHIGGVFLFAAGRLRAESGRLRAEQSRVHDLPAEWQI